MAQNQTAIQKSIKISLIGLQNTQRSQTTQYLKKLIRTREEAQGFVKNTGRRPNGEDDKVLLEEFKISKEVKAIAESLYLAWKDLSKKCKKETLENLFFGKSAILYGYNGYDKDLSDDDIEKFSIVLQWNLELRSLDLEMNGRQDTNTLINNTLFGTVSHLRSLSINNDKTNIKTLTAVIIQNHLLHSLSIANNEFGDEDAIVLANSIRKHNYLYSLSLVCNEIGNEGAIALADAVKQNKNLRSLNLMGNKVGDEGAIALADTIKQNKNLYSLDLSYNIIGDEGIKALCNAGKRNTLTSFNLSGNIFSSERGVLALIDLIENAGALCDLKFGANYFEMNEMILLSDALNSNKSIYSLDFSYRKNSTNSTDASDIGFQMLGLAIAEHNTLKVLKLEHNFLFNGNIEKLAVSIAPNKNLFTLCLSRNGFGNEGAMVLANALAQKHNLLSLDHLDISENQIGSEGVKAIAIAIAEKNKLISLDISRNNARAEGAIALAGVINALRTLNISYNRIPIEGGKALAAALEHNTTLSLLDLSNTLIGNEGGKALARALEQNKTLHYFR